MVASFNGVDLTDMIETDGEGAAILWETADPIIRTPLAYGGVSVQDSYVRITTLTLPLFLPTYATYVSLSQKIATNGTLLYLGGSFTGTTLNEITGPRRWPDGQVSCTARFTRAGLSF